jgi:hypothetical protein
MLIQVVWTNSHYDYIKDFRLDSLIESRKVARFLRSSGWVTIGVDPIRANNKKINYAGAERRLMNLPTAFAPETPQASPAP